MPGLRARFPVGGMQEATTRLIYGKTHRCRGETDSGQRKGGFGGWVRNAKGLRSTSSWLQSAHRDVRYTVGNSVNNIVITMCGARWGLELLEGPTVNYVIV